jgi:hypothetical protein
MAGGTASRRGSAAQLASSKIVVQATVNSLIAPARARIFTGAPWRELSDGDIERTPRDINSPRFVDAGLPVALQLFAEPRARQFAAETLTLKVVSEHDLANREIADPIVTFTQPGWARRAKHRFMRVEQLA